ncbi:MAG: UpxY family transcription antiterminator [Acidobacteriota bacterium]|nr:UpxY family transcription antiterminator [Acidobacteriota bacterium]
MLNPHENDPSNLAADASWHALYTRHQHEKMVAELLSKKNFDVYLPLYEATHRWKDRLKKLSLPLFPSYVFVKGGLDRQLQMMMTPGVYSILATSGRAAVIAEEQIDAVKRMVEGPLRVEPHPFLKCGEAVRVTAGPLQGIEGILIRKKNFTRLVLSIEMLMKSVAVEIDAWMVESISGARPPLAAYGMARAIPAL